MHKIVLALAAFAASPLAAHAADMTNPIYSQMPANDWRGFYIGGSVGYTSGTITGPGLSQGNSGVDVDIHGGYDFQYGNWVFGPFATAALPSPSATVYVTPVKVDWALVGGARLGYAVGRWLPYALVSGVVAHATASGIGSATHTGYGVGFGIEYALHDGWSVGARYAYTSLSKESYGGAGPFGWSGNSIVATLNYKFR